MWDMFQKLSGKATMKKKNRKRNILEKQGKINQSEYLLTQNELIN